MAKETNIPDPLFLASDHVYEVLVLNRDEDASVDVTGFALSFMLKRRETDADASALVTKTTAIGISITGTFNASPDPDVNGQRVLVTLLEANLTSLTPNIVRWELKRTDAGYNTVLAYGVLQLKLGVHRV